MRFYVGLHQPSDAKNFGAAFISVNRIRNRKSAFVVGDWIMDSGAFTEIATYGHYRHGVEEYAEQIRRWKSCGNMIAAVAQDYMCEPWMLEKTGLTVADHQRLTIERYDALLACDTGACIMPVMQGYAPADYAAHMLGAAQDRGNYSDDAIIARAGRLIALRDLHIAQRDHKPTKAILARLRAYTAGAL